MGNNLALLALLPILLFVEGSARKTKLLQLMMAVILTFVFFTLRHMLNQLSQSHSPATQVSYTNDRSLYEPYSDENNVTIPGPYQPSESAQRFLRNRMCRRLRQRSEKAVIATHQKDVANLQKNQEREWEGLNLRRDNNIRKLEAYHDTERTDVVRWTREKHEEEVRRLRLQHFPDKQQVLERMFERQKQEMAQARLELEDMKLLEKRQKRELESTEEYFKRVFKVFKDDSPVDWKDLKEKHRRERDCFSDVAWVDKNQSDEIKMDMPVLQRRSMGR